MSTAMADLSGARPTGTRLRLELPVEPRLTLPDPRIDSLRSSVAVEAGPLVMCAESVDLPPGVSLREVGVAADGVPVGTADTAEVPAAHTRSADDPWPYGPKESATADRELTLPLIPYHRWAERGPSEMRVWLPLLPSGGSAAVDGPDPA